MSFIRRLLRRLVDGGEAPEAPPLLDTLARAPGAAALVVAALGLEDRRALRLVHTQLRDAVGETTTKLEADLRPAGAARPPTAARWPRLEDLTVVGHDLAALEALGEDTWESLRALHLENPHPGEPQVWGEPAARALAKALWQMPGLFVFTVTGAKASNALAAELFDPERECMLSIFSIWDADLSPAAARMLAAAGWLLESLDLSGAPLRAAGLAALLAAPTFVLRRLALSGCSLDAAALSAIADAPWPLEELSLDLNDFSAADGPALAALARHRGLCRLDLGYNHLNAAGFKALVEAAWPALITFGTVFADVEFDGPHALDASAFAGFPALEELDLSHVPLGEAGARLLASRRWARLKKLNLDRCRIDDAGLAALALGAWPALAALGLNGNDLGAPPTLEDARRWAPALEKLLEADAAMEAGASSESGLSDGEESDGE
jgi:hypothetical protein